MELEPEQEDLLSALVEDARSVPRSEREDFVLLSWQGGAMIEGSGSGEFPDFHTSDLEVLRDAGLIGVSKYTKSGGFVFYLTPQGLRHYEDRKRRADGPAEQVEEEIGKYLESARFQSAYPAAYAKWAEAANMLWASDSERQLTTIGHLAREVLQEFTTALVDRHQPPDVSSDPTKTVARLRAVIEQHSHALGSHHSAMLKALLAYWGTVNDLVQRQEHGGQKEREPLKWEDGRRVVFQTAVVMFEIARVV